MDHHDSEQTHSSGFGRGWIPASRNIGLPGEGALSSPLPVTGAARGGSAGSLGYRPHPNLSAEGAGLFVLPPGPPAAAGAHCWTAERKIRFLEHLAQKGNVRAAVARVGFSPEAAYRLRRRDPVFAAAWAAALVLARDHAEQVLATRAIDGVEEPIYYRGDLIGRRVRHDTRLLLAHLARLDRAAEAPFAEARAGRFDELLALVGDLAPPPELVEDIVTADGSDGTGPAWPPEDPMLPAARDRFVAEAGMEAEDEARALAAAAQAEAGPDLADAPDGAEETEAEADARYRSLLAREQAAAQAIEEAAAAAGDTARAAAAECWDGWEQSAWALTDSLAETRDQLHARVLREGLTGLIDGIEYVDEATAYVRSYDDDEDWDAGEDWGEEWAEKRAEDEAGAAPLEYKSLGGPGGAPLRRRAGFVSLNPVNCVNRASGRTPCFLRAAEARASGSARPAPANTAASDLFLRRTAEPNRPARC